RGAGPQRQPRAVIAPCPDELAWIAKLAGRFGVELSPHASHVFDEVSATCYGGLAFGAVGEHALLPGTVRGVEPVPSPRAVKITQGEGLRLVAYRPLFSGAAVERTPELAFQQPHGEIELARADARARGISTGDAVTVSSNGTSLSLRARIASDVPAGMVRMPRAETEGLHELVEVSK